MRCTSRCAAQLGNTHRYGRVPATSARRLYSRSGYVLTEDIKCLSGGDEILRYEARLTQLSP